MSPKFRVLGLDIGAVSVSAAELGSDGEFVHTAYELHCGDIEATLEAVLKRFVIQ